MTAIDAIKAQINQGMLRITPKGEIWKLAAISGGKKKISITPKRAECKLKNGYLGITVCMNGRQFLLLAHRAVWTILVGRIPGGMDINHKDGNKRNNDPKNMEVVTRSENLYHAVRTGLKPYNRIVPVVSMEAKRLRAAGLSYSQIAKQLKVSQTTAFKAVRFTAT
jgi:hypothetical protein